MAGRIFFILLLSLTACGSDSRREPSILKLPGPVLLRFSGAIEALPPEITDGKFQLRFRAYYCQSSMAQVKESEHEPANASAHKPVLEKGNPEKNKPANAGKNSEKNEGLEAIVVEPGDDCLFRYFERVEDFDFGKYFAELRVEQGWTHASVEILNTEKTRGRYSPGHNPYWFTPASYRELRARDSERRERQFQAVAKKKEGSTDSRDTEEDERYSRRRILEDPNQFYLTHTFVYRSQENPIGDKEQADLAERFAPIIVLARNKQFIPSNLEKFHNRFEKGLYKTSSKKGAPESFFDPAELPYLSFPEELPQGATHLYYHVRYAGAMVSGTQPEALPGFRDNENYYYEKGDGSRVISYWLWFDGNAGPSRLGLGNYHQGDLESIAVLVDAKGRPMRFMATGHDHITLDTDWHKINQVNDHPIIYIGSGNGSDGGNPVSAYGGHEVELDGGSSFLTWLARPIDVFPDAAQGQLIIPAGVAADDLKKVKIGRGESVRELDLSGSIKGRIARLVQWEEPGWINVEADLDPDGHHKVEQAIAPFLSFEGSLGRHPTTSYNIFRLRKEGSSPRNAPFKTNIEQHYTFERPRMDRSHSGIKGGYGPR